MQRNNMPEDDTRTINELPGQKLRKGLTWLRYNFGFPRIHAVSWPDLPNLADTVVTQKPDSFEGVFEETGWDRLRIMLMRDEFGELSLEMGTFVKNTTIAAMFGAFLGAVQGAKQGREAFVKAHATTVFVNEIDGRRRLLDAVAWNFFKGGCRVGWRLGTFCGIYFFTGTAISVYRNKTTVFEYMAGGALAGGLYRWKNGIRAITSTSIIGGFFGLITGVAIVGTMWATGTTYEEIHYWKTQRRRKHQSELYNQAQRIREEKYPELAEHSAILAEIEERQRSQQSQTNPAPSDTKSADTSEKYITTPQSKS